MFKLKITQSTKNIEKRLTEIQKDLDTVPNQAYKFFKYDAPTPIKSGNARKNTTLSNSTIEANYPYAKRLNEGYSSQAPDGMAKPTIAYVKQLVRQIIRGTK